MEDDVTPGFHFTTAVQADIIHVMDNGRIIESGTHAELATNGGCYAQSWRMQMRENQVTR
jgi:ATP-binding cassette, subfamily B, bacterial